MTIMELKDKLYYMAGTKEEADVLRETLALLRTHPDAQPNEPLTLVELRSMLDCPVWMVGDDEITETGWCLVHRCTNDAVEVIVPSGLIYRVISENIGEVCKFYRRPLKEGA